MDKIKLEEKIALGHTIREMAQIFGKSEGSIKHWMNKYGIKTKNKRGSRYTVTESTYNCNSCGCTDKGSFYHRGKNKIPLGKCKRCHNQQRTEGYRERKQKLVTAFGGKCTVCGYSKSNNALEFHHTDPTKKDPNYRRSLPYKDILKELKKCILVCSNCHREIHEKLNLGL